MKATHCIAFILVVIGGLNWGLIGLGTLFNENWNVVWQLLGSWPTLVAIIYILVGISTLIIVGSHRKSCATCKSETAAPMV